MPNWCSNHITVRGTNQAEILRLGEAFDQGKFCNAVIPIPEELNNPDTGSYGGEDAADKDRLREELTEKYGFSGWYDFCINRWGTKWDFGEPGSGLISDDGLEFSGSFESAWAPPMGIAEALVEQGMEVTLYYYEPGMAFVGKYENGYETHYELAGLNSQTVRAAIGDDLDDFWGISESMAEYEAENEEELTQWIREGAEANKQKDWE